MQSVTPTVTLVLTRNIASPPRPKFQLTFEPRQEASRNYPEIRLQTIESNTTRFPRRTRPGSTAEKGPAAGAVETVRKSFNLVKALTQLDGLRRD